MSRAVGGDSSEWRRRAEENCFYRRATKSLLMRKMRGKREQNNVLAKNALGATFIPSRIKACYTITKTINVKVSVCHSFIVENMGSLFLRKKSGN